MRLLLNRLTQRVGDRPATIKTGRDGNWAHPGEFSPFYDRQAAPPQLKDAVIPSVSRLFPCDRPAAVLRPVALRVVDAIQRVLRGGTWAHVFKEGREGTFPALANGNTTITVTAVGIALRIITTLDHGSPSSMLGTVAHSVCGSAKPSRLSAKATAASGISAAQTLRTDDHSISADAAAKPMNFFGFHFYRFQRREPFELLVGQISKAHTAIIDQQKETSPEFNRRKLT